MTYNEASGKAADLNTAEKSGLSYVAAWDDSNLRWRVAVISNGYVVDYIVA